MTMQNGQDTPTEPVPASAISFIRVWLIREPSFSSIHIRPPPAPQHRPCSRERSSSLSSSPGIARRICRGAS